MFRMRIHEVFKSIEGEGYQVGLLKAFIRFQGCNIGCKWCDTPKARPLDAGTEMTVEEVLEKVFELLPFGGWVSITGGEPLLQEEACRTIIYLLKAYGYRINLETSGLVVSSALQLPDFVSADIKTPSSGVADLDKTRTVLDILKTTMVDKYCLKAVVADSEDLAWLSDNFRYENNIVITPVGDNISGVVKLIMKKGLPNPNWRVVPQVHKLLKIT